MLLQETGAFAGTTGQISGIVLETSAKKPVVGAKVVAISPSQAAAVTTGEQGRFTFVSLSPDTYTISVEKSGYGPTSLTGVTVSADQIQNLSLSVAPVLQTIGRTSSRAASEVVKPGQTADVYTISATQGAAAAPLGGGGSLNQAYSAIASVPGVFVPVGQQGWGQSVYVRGGNFTQLGYEFDGVPVQRAFDAYPSSTLSALGQQEVQVYTGSQPADAQSNGLAGFINQVVKTGTYPGTGTLDLSLGTPTFYHKGQIEVGGATPDRNFSYYVATAGYNQASRFVDQFDGAAAGYNYSSNVFGTISHNCGTPQATAGCYHNGYLSAPNGFMYLPLSFGQNQYTSDRESIANFHFGLPHKKDGLKDDVQALADVSYLSLGYNDSYNSFGGVKQFLATGVVQYQGQTYHTCADQFAANATPCANNYYGVTGSSFEYAGHSVYTGPTGVPLTAANLSQVAQYAFPSSSAAKGFSEPVDPATNGTQQINDSIFKLQYTHAMGSNAFARVYGYSLYSDWLENDPNAVSDPSLALEPADYILPTHTRGLGLTIADQIGNHLLNFTGGYSAANLSRWNNSLPSTSNPIAVLVDSLNPTNGLCYSSKLIAVDCGGSSAARYTVPGTNKLSSAGLIGTSSTINVNNASSFKCGTGPCEYLAVGSGLNGSYNDVSPHFANLTLADSWRASTKLSLDAALRYDSFRYDVPSGETPGGPNPAGTASSAGRAAFTNSYDAFHCYTAAHGVVATATANSCAPGTQVAFSNANSGSIWYGGFEPRLGVTYQLNALNVLRAGYGRFLQPSGTAYTFYNRAAADIAGYEVPKFYPYGYRTPQHDIPPEESWNLDFSWEHQVKGSDTSWKISPFARTTRNEAISVILDPVTNFMSYIPALSSKVKGVEFLLRKGDFNRNGFAGQLSYTYTYETSKYQTLPGGSTALDNVNVAVRQYNAYTSYCAGHSSDARCGTPTNGTAATPCYTAAGAADGACGAGSFANPYWNAPLQPLFDPNASYSPFNQTFGTGFSSNASSYNVPHVAALILNYRRNRFSFTPSFQFEAGGRYGSPVQGIGVDPALGCSALTGSTAGDPRYPYGAAGGAPYDAQSCNGTLTGPNPYTGKFDAPGVFVEPSQLIANVALGYDVSKRVVITLLGINVFGTCFGGTKQAWTNAGPKIGCWYSSASGYQAGNLYNPGNAFQSQAAPYFPALGGINGQQAYATNINPFQLVLSAQIKL